MSAVSHGVCRVCCLQSELVAVYKVDSAYGDVMMKAEAQLKAWRQSVGSGRVVADFGKKVTKRMASVNEFSVPIPNRGFPHDTTFYRPSISLVKKIFFYSCVFVLIFFVREKRVPSTHIFHIYIFFFLNIHILYTMGGGTINMRVYIDLNILTRLRTKTIPIKVGKKKEKKLPQCSVWQRLLLCTLAGRSTTALNRRSTLDYMYQHWYAQYMYG